MLSSSFSSSNFLSKLKEIPDYDFQNHSEITKEPALLSEFDGSDPISVHFSIFPHDSSENKKTNRGSCFALLRKLVKSSHSAMPLTKDSLITILSRNSQLLDDLKQSKNQEKEVQFNDQESRLMISIDNEDVHFSVPTEDFAVVRQEESLYICTALEEEYEGERLFLKIDNFSESLEYILRNFMKPPETPKMNSFSFPILPSIDTNSLVIQPSTLFENFIDDSQEYNDESQPNSVPSEPSKPQSKSSNSSPSRPPKRADSAVKAASSVNRQCLNCFCTSTPMWRRGPDGTASLCNACGVKFKSGKLQMDSDLVENNLKKIRQHQIQSPLAIQDQIVIETPPQIQKEEEIVLHQY